MPIDPNLAWMRTGVAPQADLLANRFWNGIKLVTQPLSRERRAAPSRGGPVNTIALLRPRNPVLPDSVAATPTSKRHLFLKGWKCAHIALRIFLTIVAGEKKAPAR